MATRTAPFLAGLIVGLAINFGTPRQQEYAVQAQMARKPFASSIEQRQQIIAELQKLNRLIEEQNQILLSGRVRVTLQQQAGEQEGQRAAQ
jgi:hypothetical protein